MDRLLLLLRQRLLIQTTVHVTGSFTAALCSCYIYRYFHIYPVLNSVAGSDTFTAAGDLSVVVIALTAVNAMPNLLLLSNLPMFHKLFQYDDSVKKMEASSHPKKHTFLTGQEGRQCQAAQAQDGAGGRDLTAGGHLRG